MFQEPTKEKDAGQFICTVKNESGKLTATFTVKFEGIENNDAFFCVIIRFLFLTYFAVPPGAPTFTRKPQILQKTAESGEPAIVFDIGFQADFQPNIIWLNPKGKKMKESSRIKFFLNPEATKNQFVAQLELKVNDI